MFFEDKLREKLEMCFDIQNNYVIDNYKFDFIATFNQKSSKYVLLKKNEIYAFEINQYIVYKKVDKIDTPLLILLKDILKKNYSTIVELNNDHMSSEIIYIIESELPVDKNILKAITKFKFYKSIKMGLEGWINGGIVVINPQFSEGVSNKVAKKLQKSFLT